MKKCSVKHGHAACPLLHLLSRLGDKWSVLVIITLARAHKNKSRFSVIKKDIEGVSQRMLTVTLRNLERDGLIKRYFYQEIPPRVEYELTKLGKSILRPMKSLVTWVESNWPSIEVAREGYDKSNKPKTKPALNT